MLTIDRNRQEARRNARILIIDDQEANISLLEAILKRYGYTYLMSKTDPRDTFSAYAEFQPDLILLDLMMPHMDGFEVLVQLKSVIPEGTFLPVLVLTASIDHEMKERALSLGANDFLTKPFDRIEIILRIKNLLDTRLLHVQLQNHSYDLEEEVNERTRSLEQAQIEMLGRLAAAAEYRDGNTGQHIQRVGLMCAMLAKRLGLPSDVVEVLHRAAPLHDIGKIAIPDNILLKPGRLTDKEFEVIKTHTTIGATILRDGNSRFVRVAEEIALTHHERWDGSGYPHGLKGEAIPISGRIMSVVDVFDALTHVRPYKKAWPIEKAREEIRVTSGHHFDPSIVKAFLAMPDDTLAMATEILLPRNSGALTLALT